MSSPVSTLEGTLDNDPEGTPENTSMTPAQMCDADICLHGTCEEREGSGFFCTCDAGFTGVHCDEGMIYFSNLFSLFHYASNPQ